MSSPFGDNDYYALLGLEATASEKDIKKAYRKTALKYHPDKVGPDDEEANRLFILLTKAVEVLSDPAQRAKYDEAHAARVARQRTLEQVGKERRDMIAQLEQREDQFRRRQAEASAAAVRKAEVERLREEGIRRLREMEQQDAAAASSAASMDVDGAETGDGAAATAVIVQWTGTGAAAVTAAAPSVQELATLFGVFGEVEAVQRMKSGTAAVVFFKRRESAVSSFFLAYFLLFSTAGRCFRVQNASRD
ncbi:hypothetical protein DFJ73DRAFT_813481 [Zopfochytrium polystomum]|nr:hypothetical protein DFJ73DRAFT_813481 [Zopfochytrium polystomum]